MALFFLLHNLVFLSWFVQHEQFWLAWCLSQTDYLEQSNEAALPLLPSEGGNAV